jgi:hypothetical protein
MRTTVVIPEELQKKAKRVAAERGVSFGELVREGLERVVGTHRPKPKSGGVGFSGHSDTSKLAGEIRPKPRSWR